MCSLRGRHCQEGNIEGASRILQEMKQKGFKVNENIFNSLIIGHSQSGDMARAHGMLKVPPTALFFTFYAYLFVYISTHFLPLPSLQ
jgi:pentatricopeptide repeat protein